MKCVLRIMLNGGHDIDIVYNSKEEAQKGLESLVKSWEKMDMTKICRYQNQDYMFIANHLIGLKLVEYKDPNLVENYIKESSKMFKKLQQKEYWEENDRENESEF